MTYAIWADCMLAGTLVLATLAFIVEGEPALAALMVLWLLSLARPSGFVE